MSLLSFLDKLAAADQAPSPTERRNALTQLARTAAAALPAVVGSVGTSVAQRTGTLLDALLITLRVEWLQDEFYSRVLGNTPMSPPVSSTLVPTAIQPDLALIRTQQQQHIARLTTYISNSGGVIPARPNYDFTGGKGGAQAMKFPDVFSSTDTMLAVAQVLEDLSVRVYTGQVPLLASNNEIIENAARMFATEGRHAAHLRQLRLTRGASVKTWISGNDNGGPLPDLRAVYDGEERVVQSIAATSLRDTSTLLSLNEGLTAAQFQLVASEAFDEPLTVQATEPIIALFTY